MFKKFENIDGFSYGDRSDLRKEIESDLYRYLSNKGHNIFVSDDTGECFKHTYKTLTKSKKYEDNEVGDYPYGDVVLESYANVQNYRIDFCFRFTIEEGKFVDLVDKLSIRITDNNPYKTYKRFVVELDDYEIAEQAGLDYWFWNDGIKCFKDFLFGNEIVYRIESIIRELEMYKKAMDKQANVSPEVQDLIECLGLAA